jgi:hypothetical protein
MFSDTLEEAEFWMHQFSFLTNSASSELSKVHRNVAPKLGLGSIIYSKNEGYLLCLQATCDTVRGAGLFFFIPLDKTQEGGSPDIVIPHGQNAYMQPDYIRLSVPAKSYTKSRSLDFGEIDEAVGHIQIDYAPDEGAYQVKDASGTTYRWLANLKYKRALRIAQNMSQEITRIGFDEFEPFRT